MPQLTPTNEFSARWPQPRTRSGAMAQSPRLLEGVAVATSSPAEELRPLLSGMVLCTRPRSRGRATALPVRTAANVRARSRSTGTARSWSSAPN